MLVCCFNPPLALISPKIKAKDLRAALCPLNYFLSSNYTFSSTPLHYPFLPSPGPLPLASLGIVTAHHRAFALAVLFVWISPPNICLACSLFLALGFCSCHLPREDFVEHFHTLTIRSSRPVSHLPQTPPTRLSGLGIIPDALTVRASILKIELYTEQPCAYICEMNHKFSRSSLCWCH